MNEAAARGVKSRVDARHMGASATLPSLCTLTCALQEAVAVSDPANDNGTHAQAALSLVETAATRIASGRDAVMEPLRLAAQHLRAVQMASSDAERHAFSHARRSMSESLFEASDLPA